MGSVLLGFAMGLIAGAVITILAFIFLNKESK